MIKYYSDVTEKFYNTPEELKEAEAKVANAVETKTEEPKTKEVQTTESKAVSERKVAADKVQQAFANASLLRKNNNEKIAKKREEENKLAAEQNAEVQKLWKEYETKREEIEKGYIEKRKAILREIAAIEKENKDSLNEAYKTLLDFNRKHGKYHYSVDSEGADLFPLLFGFGQMERFGSLFDSFFNLF